MKVKELEQVLITKNKRIYRDRRSGLVIKARTIEERMKLGERTVYLIDARSENEIDILLY